MTTRFQMIRDASGYTSYVLPVSDHIYDILLTQNVESTLTVPSDSSDYVAVYSCHPGACFFVAINNTAAVATGSFAKVNSELNPGPRLVHAGDVIHVISPDTVIYFGVSLYAI